MLIEYRSGRIAVLSRDVPAGLRRTDCPPRDVAGKRSAPPNDGRPGSSVGAMDVAVVDYTAPDAPERFSTSLRELLAGLAP